MDRVNLITLGCPKNAVDSERMLRLLEINGYALTDDAGEADVIVVNTCGFIEPAKRESIETVLEAARQKSEGRCQGLIVTGCLAQRYREELQAELREADRVIGLADERDIVRHCDELLKKAPRPVRRDGGRRLTTPGHWAYLRISDGCDRTCTFCAIPGIKGPNRSAPIEDLVAEAERLVAGGVKEIALVAQDTMRYGADLYGRPRLVDLVRALLRVEGLAWLRLHYTYPSGWREELIDLLATEERLCGYVDMPVQHISDPILRAMRRGTTARAIRDLIRRLRERVPHLTLRSSVIVGFPGETEADFEALCEFVEETRFNRLGGFLYSSEEGTDAGLLIDSVPEEVKRSRLDRLMEVQREISQEINEGYVGRRL
ncbi:MAG: ribosomal protein S12 methylthiotransferase RimO, partial [Candidatus Handelsmanbacteria bacterium RIFCSPLOWO2_12_FULL_64_10]